MGIKKLVKRMLTEKENNAYKRRLQRLQVTYGDWAAALEKKHAGTVSAGRDYVVICSSKGCLARNAIKNIDSYFNAHPKTLVLYGDEDVWPGFKQGDEKAGERRSPWFKPDWSPDLLDSCLYFGSVVAVDKELFEKVMKEYVHLLPNEELEIFQKDDREGIDYLVADQSTYEDWLHICVGLAGAYSAENAAVGHIPFILFHCCNEKEQTKFVNDTSRLQDYRDEYVREFRNNWEHQRTREKGTEEVTATVKPVVSVVIPSKDHPDILEKCLRGCLVAVSARTKELRGGEKWQEQGKEDGLQDCLPTESCLPVEIILVDNGSNQENRARVEKLIREFDTPAFQIRYLYCTMEFNFSKMCNLGAKQAKGSFLLFLNDDVELCLPGCMEQMAALADRFFTGAVGIKLLYPDSVRIQHAGITNLPMGPVHKMQFLNDNKCYYYNANRGRRNVLAVTGACLMVDKVKFAETDGFAEELQVAFNDVDLCFQLYESGYWNVCMNDIYAFHHESLSRGADESPQKLIRLLAERDMLYRRHPKLEGEDPFYSVYLSREGLDSRIRPAYVTACNRVQRVEHQPEQFDPGSCRRDDCLLVRIEDSHGERISGYGVVLGDNNACYELRLLLKKVKDIGNGVELDEKGFGQVEIKAGTENHTYAICLENQYRPDLEENMPDQVNVALSGFAVELNDGILAPGSYRLGLAAKNKVTGLRLVNWSNRVFSR